MKPVRTVLVLLLAAALALSACTSNSAGKGTYEFNGATTLGKLIPAAQRKPAENFDGSLLSGGTYKLSHDDGKVTVVNFWGSWCGPCTVETPQFGLVYDKYKSKDVAFVGIDIKEADRSLPRAFVAEHHIDYPIVYDDRGETALRLGNIRTQAVPFTVLLDKQHRVAAVYVVRLGAADLEPMLNKLIAEK
jgi:thiol-disulfide isomerase/thioredoxin